MSILFTLLALAWFALVIGLRISTISERKRRECELRVRPQASVLN